jgi:DNA (cytosine-5)-methyltransferase 3A
MKIARKNHPDIIHVGDVTAWQYWNIDWSKVDLILAGSPCQGFSKMGKMLAFDDPRSALFFVFVEIYKHARKHNPNVKFLLENVKMKAEYRDTITEIMNVKPIHINSSLVSAQNRERYYWTNIENVTVPEDRGITLDSIIPGAIACGFRGRQFKETGDKWVQHFTMRKDGKSNCLVTSISTTGLYVIDNSIYTLTPEQAEVLQTLPVGYTEGVSKSQRFKMLGNGWTVEVIKHILAGIK